MKIIITAGDSADGLWPVSRDIYPELFSKLQDSAGLLQNIYKLALSVTSAKNIVIAANMLQLDDIKTALDGQHNLQIASSAANKGSAYAVSSALNYLKTGKKDETIVIMPADIAVKSQKAFIEAIEAAKAPLKKGYTAVLGVSRANSDTGFGYIIPDEAEKQITLIKEIKTSPDAAEVLEVLKSKKVFWNTGIYISKFSMLQDALSKYEPAAAEDFTENDAAEYGAVQEEDYSNIPDVSFESAAIEKLEKTAFIELKSKFKSFGLWQCVYASKNKDENGNVIEGRAAAENTAGSLIFSSKEHTASAALDGMIVVNTEDALLVCPRERAYDITKFAAEIKKHYKGSKKTPKTVIRPWGFYTCLHRGEGWLTRAITLYPHKKLSLQMHQYRSEHWVVIDGEASVILEDEAVTVNKGGSLDIPIGAKHSLQNLSDEPLKILEVQKGAYISEEDITRFDTEPRKIDTV